MSARCVMVWGTTSGAGKSWLTTALCRWYARQGFKVAPFKAQNMSNNARVVPGLDGRPGEIGAAQYFQALAARAVPDVRMNPVLLKPERDTASQVVVMGRVRADLAALPWRARSELLWAPARDALQALRAEHEVLVIEGAGSPAEINLQASDYVNLRTASEVQAAGLLVADIDRGGAFAHLYGTHQLLPPAERALLRGFVLNRFRGDAALLAPGPQQLEAMTGVPTLAVLPMWRGHGLPEEDGLHDVGDEGADAGPWGDAAVAGASASRPPLRIAVIVYPRVSNVDEFQPLRGLPGVRLVWARSVAELEGADWLVLPGSKHTGDDLAWLRERGLDRAVQRHAAAGQPVLGVCGGLQMLGTRLHDPLGLDGPPGDASGLGLLPLATHYGAAKQLSPTAARFDVATDAATDPAMDAAQGPLGGPPWQALAGVELAGYEIHTGRTAPMAGAPAPAVALRNAQGEAIGWQAGAVLGVYLHGLFESPAVLQALFGAQARSLDTVFDCLADFVETHFAPGALRGLLAQRPSRVNGP